MLQREIYAVVALGGAVAGHGRWTGVGLAGPVPLAAAAAAGDGRYALLALYRPLVGARSPLP